MAVGTWLGKPATAPAIMDRVLLALVPAVGVAAWLLGWLLLVHCVVALVAGGALEALCQCLRKRPVRPFLDRSTPVTCLLIAIGIPPTAPLWMPVIAVAVAILLAKELYGGLGRNVFNPAMAGYAVVLVAYPQSMTLVHATTGATALDALRFRGGQTVEDLAGNPAFGMLGGTGFEWVNAAALLGGVYLIAVGVVHWRIPAAVLTGIALPAVAFHDGGSSASLGSPFFHWFAGATMLAAFFIATDPVTAPRKAMHQWLFGIVIGALVFAIRAGGSYPDGVAFAVLIGNLATPVLDRLGHATAAA